MLGYSPISSHVKIFISGEWNVFLYPCLGIWLLDRILRITRILTFNPRLWNTQATAIFDEASNLVHMEIPCDKTVLKPSPGSYYYIYALDDPRHAQQNHPFTLAYVKKGKFPNEGVEEYPQQIDSIGPIETDGLLTSVTSTEEFASLVFLIRPYNGFTSRLAKHATSGPASLRVLVEGPYGHEFPLNEYKHVLFIFGGTGIAVPLSHLATLLSPTSMVKSVRLIWAVREHAFLHSVLKQAGELLRDERISLEIYVTQEGESKDDTLASGMPTVKVYAGRPQVHDVVEDAATDAGQESLAIVACGPAKMADQARQAGVEMLGRGFTGVEYFQESFNW